MCLSLRLHLRNLIFKRVGLFGGIYIVLCILLQLESNLWFDFRFLIKHPRSTANSNIFTNNVARQSGSDNFQSIRKQIDVFIIKWWWRWKCRATIKKDQVWPAKIPDWLATIAGIKRLVAAAAISTFLVVWRILGAMLRRSPVKGHQAQYTVCPRCSAGWRKIDDGP